MKKKITLTILFLNLLACTILSFYIYFQSEDTPSPGQLLNTPTIPYATLKDYLLSSGDSSTHYLFFCAPENADCIYIQNTIIKPLESKQGQSLFERINYVDVSELEQSLTTNLIVEDWGISNYPAFVAISVDSGEFEVKNFIQYSIDDPISEIELKRWLAENGIWTGLFELSDQQIILP